jgi:hypothetical protein
MSADVAHAHQTKKLVEIQQITFCNVDARERASVATTHHTTDTQRVRTKARAQRQTPRRNKWRTNLSDLGKQLAKFARQAFALQFDELLVHSSRSECAFARRRRRNDGHRPKRRRASRQSAEVEHRVVLPVRVHGRERKLVALDAKRRLLWECRHADLQQRRLRGVGRHKKTCEIATRERTRTAPASAPPTVPEQPTQCAPVPDRVCRPGGARCRAAHATRTNLPTARRCAGSGQSRSPLPCSQAPQLRTMWPMKY